MGVMCGFEMVLILSAQVPFHAFGAFQHVQVAALDGHVLHVFDFRQSMPKPRMDMSVVATAMVLGIRLARRIILGDFGVRLFFALLGGVTVCASLNHRAGVCSGAGPDRIKFGPRRGFVATDRGPRLQFGFRLDFLLAQRGGRAALGAAADALCVRRGPRQQRASDDEKGLKSHAILHDP
jgi:hypothetical protein